MFAEYARSLVADGPGGGGGGGGAAAESAAAALAAAAALPWTCPTPPSHCPPSKFRAADASCNNVRRPHWGAAGAPFLRLIPAQHRGKPLPEGG